MSKRTATMMQCDNPSCTNEEEHSREEPASGYHFGKGYWVLGGGGPIPALYVCSIKCLAPAVEWAIRGDEL